MSSKFDETAILQTSEDYEALDQLELYPECVIGKGSYGRVYKVTDKQNTVWAAKVQLVRKCIENEEEIHREIGFHRNIVQITDSFATDRLIVFKMEFVETDLYKMIYHLYNGPLPSLLSQFIGRQIVEGLQHMHEKYICHGDLKVANVLLTSRKQVKLCDFGFSAQLYGDPTRYDMVGTPGAWAPEIYKSKGVSGYNALLADLWSFGVVVYEMVTGWEPFYLESSAASESLMSLSSEEWDFPSWVSVPKEAETIIEKLLSQDPAARGSIKEILNSEWMRPVKTPVTVQRSYNGSATNLKEKPQQKTKSAPVFIYTADEKKEEEKRKEKRAKKEENEKKLDKPKIEDETIMKEEKENEVEKKEEEKGEKIEKKSLEVQEKNVEKAKKHVEEEKEKNVETNDKEEGSQKEEKKEEEENVEQKDEKTDEEEKDEKKEEAKDDEEKEEEGAKKVEEQKGENKMENKKKNGKKQKKKNDENKEEHKEEKKDEEKSETKSKITTIKSVKSNQSNLNLFETCTEEPSRTNKKWKRVKHLFCRIRRLICCGSDTNSTDKIDCEETQDNSRLSCEHSDGEKKVRHRICSRQR